MKKIKMLAGIIATSLVVASSAAAFSLGGYNGPVEIKYKNWEAFLPGFPGPTGTGQANGISDLVGIARITSIDTPGGDNLWAQGTSGEFITGAFFGLDLASAQLNAGLVDGRYASDKDTLSTSPAARFSLYLSNTSPGNPDAVPNTDFNTLDPTVPVGQAFAPNSFINGSLLLDMLFAPGIVPLANEVAGDPATVIQSTSSSLTAPFSGTGFGYLDVIGGSAQTMFDTNGYNPDPLGYGNHPDIFFRSNITAPGEFGFNTKSDDPMRANVVPEPGTFLLIGVGLLGLAAFRRKMA